MLIDGYCIKLAIIGREAKRNQEEPPFVSREEKIKLPHLLTCLWSKWAPCPKGVLFLGCWLEEVHQKLN